MAMTSGSGELHPDEDAVLRSLKAQYVRGDIEVDVFERSVEMALEGGFASPFESFDVEWRR